MLKRSWLSLLVLILLLSLNGCAPHGTVLIYNPPVNTSMSSAAARETLTTLLNNNNLNAIRPVGGAWPTYSYLIKNSTADQDVLKISFSGAEDYTLRFVDLVGKDISIKREGWLYFITLSDIRFSSPAVDGTPTKLKRFADALLTIQQELRQECDSQGARLDDFRKAVEAQKKLPTRPAFSEEQRRYIVQANSLNQQKEYAKAITLFEKAIELNETSYPAAYFNTALLHAQTGNYCKAIATMKKYLILDPEAKDARSAQDKIYEWELLLQPK